MNRFMVLESQNQLSATQYIRQSFQDDLALLSLSRLFIKNPEDTVAKSLHRHSKLD